MGFTEIPDFSALETVGSDALLQEARFKLGAEGTLAAIQAAAASPNLITVSGDE